MNALAMDLNDLYLFAQVVECQGFTAAAAALGIPKSRVSRRIALLEARLGARLLQRSSRRLSLTEAGQDLYGHCAAMLEEARAGEEAVRRRQLEPSGQIRLSMPLAIADAVLSPLLPVFMRRYPKVRLSVQATNRLVDLLEEGVDVVVRGAGHQLESSSLVQLDLCAAKWGLLASPAYLSDRGWALPDEAGMSALESLKGLDALVYAPPGDPVVSLRLLDSQGVLHEVRTGVPLRSDNIGVLKQAALAGLGIAGLPLYACAAELAAGSLQWVLPEWRPMDGRLMLLFPSRRGMAPAVRALIDFIKREMPPLLEYQR